MATIYLGPSVLTAIALPPLRWMGGVPTMPIGQSKKIDKGMIPKVQSCLRALEAGTRKAHIIDGRIRHSLLLELAHAW